MIIIACALLSGAFFYLSQGLHNLWELAWIAPLPLLWLAYGPGRMWHLFAVSLAAYACGQIYVFQCYGMPLIATALFSSLGGGALFGGAVILARAAWRGLPKLAALLCFPALWTAIEYTIGLLSPHGSYGSLAYSQVSFPAGIQLASLFGIYSVTFSLCLFSNALAMMARGAFMAGSAGLATCAIAIGFGFVRLDARQGEVVRVAAMADWDARKRATATMDLASERAMADEYAGAAQAAADKGVQFIVIPEGAMEVDPEWRTQAVQPLSDVARLHRLTIVIGVVSVNPMRNTAMAFLRDGSTRVYDKRHLLLPFEADFKPGPGPGLLGEGQAVTICKDLDFPRTLRADTLNAGANDGIYLMAVPANDFVADDWIHARIAIMRGVENGFAVVRSAFHGLETVSDGYGRVVARARTYLPGLAMIQADVPPGPGPTLYTRIGDLFAWGCMLLALVLLWRLLRRAQSRS
jgi:apolipoprotein N-acyltransferase